VSGPSDQAIAKALRALAADRGPEKTFCPSEIARQLAPRDWRVLMPRVRQVAAHLPELRATQKGREVDPVSARGPIRLSLRQPSAP